MHTPHSALCTLHGEPYTLHQQEEAQAVKMFEALLDSAASEGDTTARSNLALALALAQPLL